MIYINDSFSGIEKEEYFAEYNMLSSQRKIIVDRYRKFEDKVRSVCAYRLLQKGLLLEYGIKDSPIFEYSEYGKPSIIGFPDIHFNISHCQNAIVCGISNAPIGVDIENIRDVKDEFVNYCFNETEISLVEHSISPGLQFAILWTRKESYLKLHGKGINNDMKSVLCEIDENSVSFNTMINEEKGYVCTICRNSGLMRAKSIQKKT